MHRGTMVQPKASASGMTICHMGRVGSMMTRTMTTAAKMLAVR
jgi:hypothetical protein